MMHDYCQEFSQIKALLKQNPEGMSVTEISKALKKNKNTTGRYLDILMISGHVDMRMYGMAKVFSLSQRVPLSAMLSYSKDLIMVLDKDSRIVSINDQFLALLHLTRKEVVGNIVTHLKSPEMNMQELIGDLSSASPESPDCLITLRQKEYGETIFRQRAVSTVFDDGAKGTTYILSEVTREILREREIREWEERFRMMAENIRDAVLIIENDKCTFVNRSFVEITGYTFEELWAMDPKSIIAPEDREKVGPFWERDIIPGPGVADVQCRIRRKDGVDRDVYVRVTSVQHGDIFYHFVILTDVTELRIKDAALIESEQRFRMMADNLQDAVLIIENGRVVYCNRRLTELSGYTLEELHSTNAQVLITPETRLMINEIFRQPKNGKELPIKFQTNLICKNGEKRYIYGQINSIRQGDTVSTYVIITDVTPFAQRELELFNRIDAHEKK